jgi:hypothetical protein
VRKRVETTLPPVVTRTERIKRSLEILRRALEGFESRLLEFEAAPEGEELERKETVRPRNREGPPRLLPIPDGLPGVGNGQELGLPQAERRGDTQHKDEALRRAGAGRAVTVPGKPALPPRGGRALGEENPRRAPRDGHHRCS